MDQIGLLHVVLSPHGLNEEYDMSRCGSDVSLPAVQFVHENSFLMLSV